MEKLPPIEKIAEAYGAIADNRLQIKENSAICYSSDKSKYYTIKWINNIYYSNDNSTYWQGYIGYPIIALLLTRGLLPLNNKVIKYFSDINFKKINKKYKNDYKKALNEILSKFDEETKKLILNDMNNVYESIKKLDIVLTRKRIIFEESD